MFVSVNFVVFGSKDEDIRHAHFVSGINQFILSEKDQAGILKEILLLTNISVNVVNHPGIIK